MAQSHLTNNQHFSHMEQTELFQVQGILGKRQVAGSTEYLIKWKGYNNKEATWEPEFSLTTIKRLIDSYNTEHKKDQNRKKNKNDKKKQKEKTKTHNTTAKRLLDKSDAKSVVSQASDDSRYRKNNKSEKKSVPKEKEEKGGLRDSKTSVYVTKLDDKIKKKEQEKEAAMKAKHEAKDVIKRKPIIKAFIPEEVLEILRIVFVVSKNKHMYEVKTNKSTVLMEIEQFRQKFPLLVVVFYEKIFHFKLQ